MIQVGDKVVCVDTAWLKPLELFISDNGFPIVGRIYVVKECYSNGLRLIGMEFYRKKKIFGIPYKGGEGFYDYSHFRKLEDVKKANITKQTRETKIT